MIIIVISSKTLRTLESVVVKISLINQTAWRLKELNDKNEKIFMQFHSRVENFKNLKDLLKFLALDFTAGPAAESLLIQGWKYEKSKKV